MIVELLLVIFLEKSPRKTDKIARKRSLCT